MTPAELNGDGPRVVAVGGGHGLAATLRAVRQYTSNVTAIVATADDGGSSGRLRDQLGSIPPGDLRRCLVALADPSSLWSRTFEHRFSVGELAGHAFGNLLIAGLADASGDVVQALDAIASLMGCVGRVLPATIDSVVLEADTANGHVVGQVAIMKTGRIQAVMLAPTTARTHPDAVAAIENADQLIIGPGSLYTSVLAAAIVPDIRAAIARSTARRIYVCNLEPHVPETEGYTVADHADALIRHGIAIDQVLVSVPASFERGLVTIPVVEFDVARPNRISHDSEKLASVLSRLIRIA